MGQLDKLEKEDRVSECLHTGGDENDARGCPKSLINTGGSGCREQETTTHGNKNNESPEEMQKQLDNSLALDNTQQIDYFFDHEHLGQASSEGARLTPRQPHPH